MLFFGALALSVITFSFAATGPLNQPSGSPRSLALLLFGLGLLTAFTTGRIREVSRMPYMIRGKLFANGIPAAGRRSLDRSGFLRAAPYAGVKSAAGESLKAGEELFRFQCAGCHTMEGRRGIAKLVKGWSEEVLVEQVGRLDRMRGSMPPFMGTARERLALAKWLKYVTTERTANEGD